MRGVTRQLAAVIVGRDAGVPEFSEGRSAANRGIYPKSVCAAGARRQGWESTSSPLSPSSVAVVLVVAHSVRGRDGHLPRTQPPAFRMLARSRLGHRIDSLFDDLAEVAI